MQELHGARGETLILDLSTSLKISSAPLLDQERSESVRVRSAGLGGKSRLVATPCIHTVYGVK